MATASNQDPQAGARHRVLGIETSCDETGIAIFDSAAGVVANQLHSQIELHRAYGGVVPELASRDHIRRLVPLFRAALAEAEIEPADLDAIAYTAGPGLVGALLTGAAFGRALAYGLQVPAIAVHHMEAHLLSPLIEDPTLEPPFVALLVSGGHSQLHLVRSIGDYELLGDTLDDAAGEAFDKTAKMLGLPYPGGPAIAALALQGQADRFRFSRPMLDRPGCDFSFSGLKTQVMLAWRDSDQTDATRADIARAFEEAVVDVLVAKCGRAVEVAGVASLVISGGVGANRALRAALAAFGDEAGIRVAFPSPALCTDNGAMVAFAGSLRFAASDWAGPGIEVRARWPLAELPAMSQAS